MNPNITTLVSEELDRWVATVLGIEVLGKAKCIPDPECSGLNVTMDQSKGEDHYVYCQHCNCKTIDLMRENYTEEEANYWAKDEQKIFGHYTTCLSPILDYSSDWSIGGYLITKYDIGIYRIHYMSNFDQFWAATAPDFPVSYNEPYITAASPLEAAMRSLVKWKLEHPIENE